MSVPEISLSLILGSNYLKLQVKMAQLDHLYFHLERGTIRLQPRRRAIIIEHVTKVPAICWPRLETIKIDENFLSLIFRAPLLVG